MKSHLERLFCLKNVVATCKYVFRSNFITNCPIGQRLGNYGMLPSFLRAGLQWEGAWGICLVEPRRGWRGEIWGWVGVGWKERLGEGLGEGLGGGGLGLGRGGVEGGAVWGEELGGGVGCGRAGVGWGRSGAGWGWGGRRGWVGEGLGGGAGWRVEAPLPCCVQGLSQRGASCRLTWSPHQPLLSGLSRGAATPTLAARGLVRTATHKLPGA